MKVLLALTLALMTASSAEAFSFRRAKARRERRSEPDQWWNAPFDTNYDSKTHLKDLNKYNYDSKRPQFDAEWLRQVLSRQSASGSSSNNNNINSSSSSSSSQEYLKKVLGAKSGTTDAEMMENGDSIKTRKIFIINYFFGEFGMHEPSATLYTHLKCGWHPF